MIGITASLEAADWVVWKGVEANVSQRTYSLCVADADAVPVMLPADEAVGEAPDELLELLDAVVISGGADVDPATYGAEPEPQTVNFKPERDRFELALARRALERDLPLLGVCRGMQVLNVACGGTLDQQLADAEAHLHTPGAFTDHEVRLAPGSLAARAVGAERVQVRSHHHQGIGRLGEGLEASGWAEPGQVVEAIEAPERSFALGLLWHPEEERRSPVVAALAEAARAGVAA